MKMENPWESLGVLFIGFGDSLGTSTKDSREFGLSGKHEGVSSCSTLLEGRHQEAKTTRIIILIN